MGFAPSVDQDGKTVPAKTMWDWLDLLIVPLFIAFAAFALDGSRKHAEQTLERDRQRQQVLEGYFDRVTDLLLNGKLSGESGDRGGVARTRTLAALRLLDGPRKAQLLQFIYEAGLITRPPVIQLNGAILDGVDLDEATLSGSEIRGAFFRGASLKGANLADADLRGSDFSKANFGGANLRGALLTQAIMRKAMLRGACLANAQIDQVDFSGATLEEVSSQVPAQTPPSGALNG